MNLDWFKVSLRIRFDWARTEELLWGTELLQRRKRGQRLVEKLNLSIHWNNEPGHRHQS